MQTEQINSFHFYILHNSTDKADHGLGKALKTVFFKYRVNNVRRYLGLFISLCY